MSVSPGRSRVGDLALRVFGREVHPDWLSCRVHRRIARTGWEADLRIIDGGHAISWSSGNVRVCEVLAPAGLPLPETNLLLSCPVRHERTATLAPDARVAYHASVDTERLDPQVFAHISEELALDPSRDDLFFRYPSTNRLAPAPLTRLHLEPRARGLAVHAFHTLPEERAVVRVSSLFEVLG